MTDEEEGVIPEEGSVVMMEQEGVVKEKGINRSIRKFFHRSNSTVCLGKLPHSPFDPLVDVLPLAEKPQLMDSVQVHPPPLCDTLLVWGSTTVVFYKCSAK